MEGEKVFQFFMHRMISSNFTDLKFQIGKYSVGLNMRKKKKNFYFKKILLNNIEKIDEVYYNLDVLEGPRQMIWIQNSDWDQ